MYPFQNSKLDFKSRVKDLVGRMTLEEKISQMLHQSPGIERLGIPAYNWWSEALHGVARAGVATVFSQAIGMAATFDAELIEKVATIISDEARAKHHEFIKAQDYDMYKGLTFWAPNINIFRDPRWGRGQETYGEDPYLTAQIGLRFVKGLQGKDEKYLKIAACAKHFAVHSGPENLRHEFDAVVSKKDMYETYLPAFKTLVKEGNVESVMGAYNRVNGEPACGSVTLLQEILRKDWKFMGHVVSDCWAICDFHLHHKVTNSPEESAAMAVKAGSDLNCGKTYPSLLAAVEKGLITEKEITRAVSRLFMTRFKLGMFDQEEDVCYSKIPFEEIDNKAHNDVSLHVAKRSMVLLKNDGILPLKTEKIRKVAVIGPNANDETMLLGNYVGTPSKITTPLRGIQNIMEKTARVFYAKGCEIKEAREENLAKEKDRISEAISIAKRSDIAIVCLGLNSNIEGEEGDEGNSNPAGDKQSLLLPGLQNTLLKAVMDTKVPTIAVIFSGSPMDLSWADQHVNAVVQAWYPGPHGGKALAELLFGKSDFTGRLPVTFVKSTEDLPDFLDYSMEGRTYRFLKKKPLYAFGYGLTYNTYIYKNLFLEKKEVNAEETQRIYIEVTNKGVYDSYEVVQVYLKDVEASVRVPNCKLIGFQSVFIKSGETKKLTFSIAQEHLCVVNEEGRFLLEPGEFQVFVGGSAPVMKPEETKESNILMASFNLL